MITRQIALESLSCRSAFEPGLAKGPPDIVAIGDDRMQVARVDNVLYLPELRLQVIHDRYVPLEAILKTWYVQFEQDRNFSGMDSRYADPFEVSLVDADVCILANLYSRNFGHWTEELKKVVVLEAWGFKGLYVFPDLPQYCLDYILLLGIDRDRLVTELPGPTQFTSAVYGTPVSHQSVQLTGAIRLLRDELWAASDASADLPTSRIWVDRGSNRLHEDREIVNRDEVDEYLEEYGFMHVNYGGLSPAQQIAVDKQVTVLAGPHGAGFSHTGLLRDGCDVIEAFSPLFINPSIMGLCHALKHRYRMLVAHNTYIPYEHGLNVFVEIPQLLVALQSL